MGICYAQSTYRGRYNELISMHRALLLVLLYFESSFTYIFYDTDKRNCVSGLSVIFIAPQNKGSRNNYM